MAIIENSPKNLVFGSSIAGVGIQKEIFSNVCWTVTYEF